jgi:hypothetical protein
MSKFTPGPWRAVNDSILGPEEVGPLCGKRGQRLASVYTRIQHSGDGLDNRPADTFEEASANARLIVAAPKMHAALRAVLLFHSGRDWRLDAAEWEAVTGQKEASTKTLCDFVRSVLAETEGCIP